MRVRVAPDVLHTVANIDGRKAVIAMCGGCSGFWKSFDSSVTFSNYISKFLFHLRENFSLHYTVI